MDENSRAIHRFRPRPYDLRRKVLLKNFLREQMTYIPPLRRASDASSEEEGDSNFNGDSNSIGSEEDMENLQSDFAKTHLNFTKEMSSEQPPSSSIAIDVRSRDDCASKNSTETKDTEPIPSKKFSLVSSLLKIKSSQKRRRKGVSKAKNFFKSVKSPNKSKSTLHFKNNTKLGTDKPAKDKRSFFSLFKSRREKRNKVLNSKKTNSSTAASTPPWDSVKTISQSVQTDISWPNEKYNELEQSNKCLQEENRLLSQSISDLMDIKTSPKKETIVTPEYHLGSRSETSKQESVNSVNHSTINLDSSEKSYQRSKLLRSKSVQEKCHNPAIHLRSKSMYFPGTSKKPRDDSPKREQSNKGLQEENRLLSQSTSDLMNIKTSPEKKIIIDPKYFGGSRSETSKQETLNSVNHSTFKRGTSKKMFRRNKLWRSKSVQEKYNPGIHLLSKSMNFPGTSKRPRDDSPEREQSNKDLQEENRLLSESTSDLMNIKTSLKKKIIIDPKYFRGGAEGIVQRKKPLRSKSVQEKTKNPAIHLHSKSMNFPGTSKRPRSGSTEHEQSNKGLQEENRLLSQSVSNVLDIKAVITSESYWGMESLAAAPKSYSLFPKEQPSVLQAPRESTLPKIVVSKRSMNRDIPLLLQESNSDRTHTHRDTHGKVNVPVILPPAKGHIPIIKVNRKPERTPSNDFRSVYRRHSIKDRDCYNRRNKDNSRMRSTDDNSRSVSLTNLPDEAFY